MHRLSTWFTILSATVALYSHATTFTQGHNLNGHAITNAGVITANEAVGVGIAAPRVHLDVSGHTALGNAFGRDASSNASNNVLTIQHTTTNWAQRDNSAFTDLIDDGLAIKLFVEPAQQPEGIKTYGSIYAVIQTHGPWNYDRSVAVQGEAIHRGGGAVEHARGVVGAAIMEADGVMNYGVGGRFIVAQNWNTTASSLISNAIGVLVESGLPRGTTIRRAGIQIKPCAASSNTTLLVMGRNTLPDGHFAVYNDSTLSNYFRGRMGCGTQAPTAQLDVSAAAGYNQLRLRSSYTPSSSADANGAVGDLAWDSGYVYVKTPDGWKRAALQSF